MMFVMVYFFFVNVVGIAVLVGEERVDAVARAHPAAAWAWWHTCRAAQTLHSISVGFALVVVLLYWLLIFGGESDSFALYRDYSQHGFYWGLAAIDLALSCNRPPDRQALIAVSMRRKWGREEVGLSTWQQLPVTHCDRSA